MTKATDKSEQGLTIITTHINADFDAMASLLAAQKLYPGSLTVFPGSQEKNLRNFFINSMVYLYNMADIKDIDYQQVRRLVLVDTRQPGRIGDLANLLDRPDVDIHVYDHHPPMPGDIAGSLEHCRITGATVTILTEILQEKGLAINADEATIMCLGIYEDTGSFTFSSTTEADFKAAAYLLSNGANLNIVSNLISRELGPEQVALLNDMIQAATRYRINEVDLVVTSVTTEKYVTDFAFLVHKMVKMERLDAIFALARMGNKIYLVARSRIPEVDVGNIIQSLGGGGHANAAAATIKEQTLAQVEHALIDRLYAKVRPKHRATDLMSAPPISVDVSVSCRKAADILTRYNINALLVTETDNGAPKLSGYITRQVIEKALYHGLEAVDVREYMSTEFSVVSPKAELEEIQDKIIEGKQRILPVLKGRAIEGVITRTDLLHVLVRRSKKRQGRFPDPLSEKVQARTRVITKFMKERLPDQLLDTLRAIGETAEKMGYRVYVVGGFVRDLFLYRANEDLDVVIEGDGIAFARTYAKTVGARIHAHDKFGTAVIIFDNGFKVDVASARMEYYSNPAALPTIEMSSIKLDMFRRDFTINTLAIQLNPNRFGTLIDFFSAMRDLKEKAIRVLHNLSFVEDPTRVFRAIRFETRFGFTIGKLTSGLIENAVKMDFFKRLSGRRVFLELRLILSEDNPVPAILRMGDFNLLQVVHPGLEIGKGPVSLLNSIRNVLSWYDLLFLEESYMKWAVYFAALLRIFDRKETEKICRRFELAPRHKKIFCQERFNADSVLQWLERSPNVSDSDLYRKLSPLRTEMVLYLMGATRFERVKRSVSRFMTRLRFTRISVGGKDLKELGITPGPIYRRIMDALLDAKLDGKLKTHEEELAFIKKHFLG